MRVGIILLITNNIEGLFNAFVSGETFVSNQRRKRIAKRLKLYNSTDISEKRGIKPNQIHFKKRFDKNGEQKNV
jgi:hypothetical protein